MSPKVLVHMAVMQLQAFFNGTNYQDPLQSDPLLALDKEDVLITLMDYLCQKKNESTLLIMLDNSLGS